MNGIHVPGGIIPVKNHPEEVITFDLGGGWGDCIRIEEWPKKGNENLASVSGHKNPKPRIGDKFRVPCQSGKVMLCEFVNIKTF